MTLGIFLLREGHAWPKFHALSWPARKKKGHILAEVIQHSFQFPRNQLNLKPWKFDLQLLLLLLAIPGNLKLILTILFFFLREAGTTLTTLRHPPAAWKNKLTSRASSQDFPSRSRKVSSTLSTGFLHLQCFWVFGVLYRMRPSL